MGVPLNSKSSILDWEFPCFSTIQRGSSGKIPSISCGPSLGALGQPLAAVSLAWTFSTLFLRPVGSLENQENHRKVV